jgi:hypothetical protein
MAIAGNPTIIPLTSTGGFPAYLTGIGIASHMTVTPNNVDYDGVLVNESVTPVINSCPSSWNVCSGSTIWSVGETGGTQFGSTFPPAEDEIWDFHEFISNVDKLTQAGLGACAADCSQTYYCYGGPALGTFTISYAFTKGKIQGQSVTLVTVTKH